MMNTASKPLPPALTAGPEALPSAAREKIRKLTGPEPGAFIKQALGAWTTIILSIWAATLAQNIFVSLLTIFIVASRQNVLGLLVHEQSHCLLGKAKFGDPIANFLCAYPLLVLTVENYSQVHLRHHRYFFSIQEDPDIQRKTGTEWTFPMKPSQLAKIFLKDLTGINIINLVKGKKLDKQDGKFQRPNILPSWSKWIYYGVFAAFFSMMGIWDIVLLYWILPLLTVFQVFVRWGAICEHQYIPEASVIDTSPIILPKWWEKLLMPNLNFSLHPYHHFFPGIAHNHLPEVHEIFNQEGLVNNRNVFYGNLEYLKFLIRKDTLS